MQTVQDDQYNTDCDLIQDKHTVVQKKLFQIVEVITQVELENVAENVTMDTSVGDATQHQPDVVMLKQIQLPDFDDKCTEWIASIDQLDTAVHLNTNLTYSQRIVNLKYCLSGPPVETNDEPIIN